VVLSGERQAAEMVEPVSPAMVRRNGWVEHATATFAGATPIVGSQTDTTTGVND
jgi:hypothetical protein